MAAVDLFDEFDVFVSTHATILDAVNAATSGYRIAVNAGLYVANPETVTYSFINNLTFTLPGGVTPQITISDGVTTTATLAGTGDGNLTGNLIGNTLTGNAGANIIDGGGGIDNMIGRAGDDIYIVDDASDTITELVGEGTDEVRTTVNYILPSFVENITITSGNADVDGNTLANILTAASNGANDLRGGAGDDTYVINNVGDRAFENALEGTDLVISNFNWTLGANFENLTLTGAATQGFGNNLDNRIVGNAENNTLVGRNGDDTFVVQNVGDSVQESAGEGTDTVESSVTYTLQNNVENLTLTGTDNIDGTGNSAVNTIIGNSGNNRLDGGFNAGGLDTLTGGAGDDTYVIQQATFITENPGEGIDTVESNVAGFTLLANFENLTLVNFAAFTGVGNDLDNVITGNFNNNTLSGGAGNDTIDGGTGADAMDGGADDDTYTIDNLGDTVTEAASEGTDTVRSSVTYTLGANLENLELLAPETSTVRAMPRPTPSRAIPTITS